MLPDTLSINTALAKVDEITAAGEGSKSDIISAALLNYGAAFVIATEKRFAQDAEQYMDIKRTTWKMVFSWLRDVKLSERADEDERRARFALWLITSFPQLSRLAANAVFRLPTDHLLRDVEKIK